MRVQEILPVDGAAQRLLGEAWRRAVSDGAEVLPSLGGVRAPVLASWARALDHGVAPGLARAPLPLDGSALDAVRAGADWLSHADLAVNSLVSGASLEGHILALFDANARMLAATGDPGALEGLADINFRPGALWSEEAVGTNGPGTALALARAFHIVGAEHFCQRWHAWHCAAVPIRDPLTQEVIGVLDLSGFRDRAHPHSLSLASAIAAALEQRLATREAERRVTLLRRFSTLIAQYPADAIVVVDRAGEIIASSAQAERLVRRLAASGREASEALLSLSVKSDRTDMTRWGAPSGSMVRDASHPLLGATAAVHALHDGRTAIGACLVLPSRSGAMAVSARPPIPPPERAAASAPARPTITSREAGVRYTLDLLLGNSAALDDVRRLARACARTDLPVLLLGESGTGKEVVAQGIHAASPRTAEPFVAVNCAALPRDLVESELFGHVAGAFSGARREGAAGKFEAAHGGTLFLDEIGELSPAAQASLLRVLQEGEVTRLGSHSRRRVDVRIIAATNRDVTTAIASGILRDDLFHRLNVLTIPMPPLRARHGDAVLLARHFLATAPLSLARRFAPDVLDAFARYSWPGNVRELENLVKRVAALAEDALITVDLLPSALRAAPLSVSPRPHQGGHGLREEPDAADNAHGMLRDAMRTRYAALIASHATVSDAARSIGVTRSTLYRRLQRIGLVPGRAVRDAH